MRSTEILQPGDPSYHLRHSSRTLRRAACIATNMPTVESFLDVGCNQGLTTSYLLGAGKISHAAGIEFSEESVATTLLSDQRFRLFTGDLCDVRLAERYDAIFYGAVHHHIMRERGLGEAVVIFKHLAEHCNRFMFFETGQLTEGGRWQWQRAIRRYFRTDEEHVYYMLRTIEQRLHDFRVIGRFWIHGVRRWLMRLELKESEQPCSAGRYTNRLTLPLDTSTPVGRTFGSKGQALKASPELIANSGVEFRKFKVLPQALFLKHHIHHCHADDLEFHVAQQIPFAWAVRPISYADSGGLVFPLVDGTPISQWLESNYMERQAIANRLVEIWQAASQLMLKLPDSLLLPTGEGIRLLDVIDMNPNNLLVIPTPDGPQIRVVDFEPQSNHYLWHNRLRFARLLWRLGGPWQLAIREFVRGSFELVAHLIRAQFKTIEWRVINRQPSGSSLMVTEARSAIGSILIRTIPSLAEK